MKSSKDGRNPISDIENKEDKLQKDEISMKASRIVPSFKYHIGAKDGIRLIVDLNLKRSDWLRSMEKTFCVCQNHLKPEFGSFRKEVECLGSGMNGKDKTTLSDASMSSYLQNMFSIKSMSEEIGKTITSKRDWSKFDQSSEDLENVVFSCEKDSSFSGMERVYLENEEMINSPEVIEVSGEENVCDDGPKRKKRYHKSGQSHERILRSTKLFGGQIVESGGFFIRRSSRLHSK